MSTAPKDSLLLASGLGARACLSTASVYGYLDVSVSLCVLLGWVFFFGVFSLCEALLIHVILNIFQCGFKASHGIQLP